MVNSGHVSYEKEATRVVIGSKGVKRICRELLILRSVWFWSFQQQQQQQQNAPPGQRRRDPERERYEAELQAALRRQEAERAAGGAAGAAGGAAGGGAVEGGAAKPATAAAAVGGGGGAGAKPTAAAALAAALAGGDPSAHGPTSGAAQPRPGFAAIGTVPASARRDAPKPNVPPAASNMGGGAPPLPPPSSAGAAGAARAGVGAGAAPPGPRSIISRVPPAHLAAAEATPEGQQGAGGVPDGGGEGEEGGGVKVLGKLAPRSEQAEAARKALEAQELARKTKAAAKLQELEKKMASKKKEEERPPSALLDGALPVRPLPLLRFPLSPVFSFCFLAPRRRFESPTEAPARLRETLRHMTPETPHLCDSSHRLFTRLGPPCRTTKRDGSVERKMKSESLTDAMKGIRQITGGDTGSAARTPRVQVACGRDGAGRQHRCTVGQARRRQQQHQRRRGRRGR